MAGSLEHLGSDRERWLVQHLVDETGKTVGLSSVGTERERKREKERERERKSERGTYVWQAPAPLRPEEDGRAVN